jgi:hypothetical protein
MKIKFVCPFCSVKLVRTSSKIPTLKDKAIRILMEDVKDHILWQHEDKIIEEEE